MTIIDVPRNLAERPSTFRRALQADPCTYCPDQHAGTIDHVHPRALGGENYPPTNLVGACDPCNQAKRDTTLLLWLLERNTTLEEYTKPLHYGNLSA